MEDRRQLELIGITYNQVQAGVYALILREVGTRRCLPIVIGAAEAQSIECKLQNIITPRPLTHDLMVNMMRAFGISISHVFIRQMPDKVFAADIYITDSERTLVMDARSSDAIALSVRMGVPVYTSAQLLDEVGFEPRRIVRRDSSTQAEEVMDDNRASSTEDGGNVSGIRSLAELTENQLEQMLTDAVSKEYYEEAARIKEELSRRGK